MTSVNHNLKGNKLPRVSRAADLQLAVCASASIELLKQHKAMSQFLPECLPSWRNDSKLCVDSGDTNLVSCQEFINTFNTNN